MIWSGCSFKAARTGRNIIGQKYVHSFKFWRQFAFKFEFNMKDERSTLQQESTELLVHVLSCVCSCVSRSPGLHVQCIVSVGITQRGAKMYNLLVASH